MNHPSKAGSFSQRKEVRKLIQEWEYIAGEHTLVLLSLDPVQYHQAHGGSALLYELEDLLYYAPFFPTHSFWDKVQQLGLPLQIRKWFVPMSDILGELDALTASGEIRFKDGEGVLETIQTHLHTQWWEKLVRWFDAFVSDQEAKEPNSAPAGNPSTNEAKQKTADGPFQDAMPEDWMQLAGLAQKLEATADEASIAKLIGGLFCGDHRTKFLGSLPVAANGQKCGEDAFLRRFFSLFSLLDRQQEYLSEEAFHRSPQHRLIPYPTYQAAVVKTVVQGYWDFRNEQTKQSE